MLKRHFLYRLLYKDICQQYFKKFTGGKISVCAAWERVWYVSGPALQRPIYLFLPQSKAAVFSELSQTEATLYLMSLGFQRVGFSGAAKLRLNSSVGLIYVC